MVEILVGLAIIVGVVWLIGGVGWALYLLGWQPPRSSDAGPAMAQAWDDGYYAVDGATNPYLA